MIKRTQPLVVAAMMVALSAPAHATSPGIALPDSALRVAPGFCRTEVGGVTGYISSCMRTHLQRPNLLPRACAVNVRDGNRSRRVYESRCLIDHGWRVS